MNTFLLMWCLGSGSALAAEAGWSFSLSRNRREVLTLNFASLDERDDTIVTPEGSFRVWFHRADGDEGPLMWFHFWPGTGGLGSEALCGGALTPMPDPGPPRKPFKAVTRNGPWTCRLESIVESAERERGQRS